MAFKLNKTQEKEFTELVNAAESAVEDLISFIQDEVIEPHEETFSEKSDAWQEGDTGQKVSNWIGTWQNFLDDISDKFDNLPEVES